MLKTLIKKQILELFQSYFIDKKTGKTRNLKEMIVFLGLMILVFLSLGVTFYSMSSSLGEKILNNGMNWIYFSVIGILSIALGVFASVFNTYASLYLPKDNELILSFPIKVRTVVLSRLIGVYTISLMYSALIWIPGIIAYYVLVPLNICNIIFPILVIFVLALFVTILSCLLGFVVAVFSSKTNGNNLLKVFFSLFILAIYYIVYYRITDYFSQISENIENVSVWIKSWLHYIYWIGEAADGKILSMILLLSITFALASIGFFIITKTFMKLSIIKNNNPKVKNKTLNYNQRTVDKALLMREYKSFTSVSTWMLNGGLGLLIMPVLSILIIIKGNMVNSTIIAISLEMPNLILILPVLILIVVCFIVSTNCILAVSISIEGKTFWQLKALPVTAWQVLRNKEKMSVQMNFIAAVPFILAAYKVLNIQYLEMVLIFLGVYIFAYLMADFGLFLNLKNPNFSWTNAASLTKQSIPVMINLFGGWILNLVLIYGGMYLSGFVNSLFILSGYVLLFAILCLILRSWLKNKGTKIFNEL